MTENTRVEELVDRLKHGDKDAYRYFFNLYAPQIFRFALIYLRNVPDAEELIQDVFLKVWEKRGQLNPDQNIKGYIYKIAVNTIYDYIRLKNLGKAYADFTSHHSSRESESAWNDVIWKEMRSMLGQLIIKMPYQQQTVFLLSREKGLSNHEIAQKLNLSKRTVENHLYKATSFLKEKLCTETTSVLLLFCALRHL